MTTKLAAAGSYLTTGQRQQLEKELEAVNKNDWEFINRIRIMLLADEGVKQSKICDQVGCSPLTARYWIVILKTGQYHLWSEQPIGRPAVVTDRYVQRLKAVAASRPKLFGYNFPRWTGELLRAHMEEELGISISSRHVNRILREK